MNHSYFSYKLKTGYRQSSQNSYKARHLKGNENLPKGISWQEFMYAVFGQLQSKTTVFPVLQEFEISKEL